LFGGHAASGVTEARVIAQLRATWAAEDSRFLRQCLLASLALHLVTAYFSVGYHSADEQFQILEFLGYKLGLTPLKDLAVEFGARMRPWLQPGIYYALTRAAQAVGVESPHAWAFLFRVFTGLVGWFSLAAVAFCARDWIADRRTRRLAYAAIALTWFLPALQVRPSSESLSGSCFLLGASITWLAARWASGAGVWFVAGIFLGASFEARFQSGFMVAGLTAWWLTMGRLRDARKIGAGLLGGLLVFALGRVVGWVRQPREN
jgi:phosphatidylinositol glycan class B